MPFETDTFDEDCLYSVPDSYLKAIKELERDYAYPYLKEH